MIFSKYLIETKNRLLLIILSGFSSFIAGYAYKEILLFLFIQPSSLIVNPLTSKSIFYFIFTDVTEIFLIYLKLSYFLSIQILILAIIYQMFLFFSPAFYKKEFCNLRFGFLLILNASGLSLFLSTQLIIPLTWNFFSDFQLFTTVNLHFEAKLSEYINFYIFLYYLCFFYCQTIVILLLFIHNLNVNIKFIRKFRKLFYFILILFSTLLSPPDAMSQLLISSFLAMTCEILLIISLYKMILNKFSLAAN